MNKKTVGLLAKQEKPKIAIIGLTTCSGCQVEIFNLGERLLKTLDLIEIGNFPLVEEARDIAKYDIAFIEGSIITKENLKELKKVRKKSKFLIALGACACIGGIPEMKNYEDRNQVIKTVYKSVKKIDNPEIKPLKEYVKVDFEIPGCPPEKNEIYRFICELLAGRKPKISQKPICYECQLREYDCLLQKGLPCLGPITLAGCEAICLRSKLPCMACRGLLKNPKIANYIKILQKHKIPLSEFLDILERFGVKDEVFKEIKKLAKNKK